MPNIFDQFDEVVPQSTPSKTDAPLKVTIYPKGVEAPTAPAPTNVFDQFDESPLWGVGKSAGIGAVKGTIGAAGMFGDLRDALHSGVDLVANKFGIEPQKVQNFKDVLGYVLAHQHGMGAVIGNAPNSGDIRNKVEQVTGPFYEPKTTAEKYIQNAAEFVPATLVGGPLRAAPVAARTVFGGVIPGLTSEAAGQYTKDSPYEPYARAGTAIATSILGHRMAQPSTPSQIIRDQLPDWITDAHINQAERLIANAANAGDRGVNLTWPEALSQVTGRPVLSSTQRIVESAPQSRAQMEEFFGQRPQQIEQAAQREFANIAPPTPSPSTIGPTVGQAAEGTVNDIRAAISRATRPAYDAGGQTLVPRDVHTTMMANPLFEDALNAVRRNTAKNSFVLGHSDRSVAVYDAVKKELRERAQNAAAPANPDASQAVASATGTMADAVRRVAVAADRGSGNYEAALEGQRLLRQRYLNPILHGPLGKLADQHLPTRKAIDILFPAESAAGTEHEIATAVSAVSKRAPDAARQLVRAHLEMNLDEAFNAAGRGQEAAQFSGAGFALRTAGNPTVQTQRYHNMRAAVESLPNGQQVWTGFERFLQMAQATGTRQPKGSLTSFNTREIERMSRGGAVATIAKHGLSPGEWWHLAHDAIGRWQLAGNLNELARLMTDPQSANVLRNIARMPPNSGAAWQAAMRLGAQINAGRADNQRRAPAQ